MKIILLLISTAVHNSETFNINPPSPHIAIDFTFSSVAKDAPIPREIPGPIPAPTG